MESYSPIVEIDDMTEKTLGMNIRAQSRIYEEKEEVEENEETLCGRVFILTLYKFTPSQSKLLK